MIGCDNPEVSEFATILPAVSVLCDHHNNNILHLQRWAMLDNIVLLYALHKSFILSAQLNGFTFNVSVSLLSPKENGKKNSRSVSAD